MMPMRHISLLLLSLLALPALAEETCETTAQCNQAGTAAYQAGRFDAAIEAFGRQLRRAENDDQKGLELALNNLMLANLRAGDAGMARAWLGLALQNNFTGPATLHNLAKVTAALDYPALNASPVGRYLRYGGQGVWSVLDISEAAGGGYDASFAPIRAGAKVEEYGPAAIGELEGKLVGDAVQMRLSAADLDSDCTVQLLREGIELRVLEVFAEGCQEYGGMGISVAGQYIKIASQVRQ